MTKPKHSRMSRAKRIARLRAFGHWLRYSVQPGLLERLPARDPQSQALADEMEDICQRIEAFN